MNIRRMILVPFYVVLAIIAVMFFVFEQARLQNDIKRSLSKTSDTFTNLIRFQLKHDEEIMETALFSLAKDEKIIEALKKKNKSLLYSRSEHIFHKLKSKYEISHLYFHSTDHKNILRLHEPDHFDDLILRESLKNASITKSMATGIEQGPSGATVLRVVTPVFQGQEIIGFIELGKDFQAIVESAEKITGLNALMIVPKKKVIRENWENRNNKYLYKTEWNFLKNHVIMASSVALIPNELKNLNFNLTSKGIQDDEFDMKGNGYHYRSILIPFLDQTKSKVADIMLLIDVKNLYAENYNMFFILVVITLLTLFFLGVYFFRFLGKIEKLILNQQMSIVHRSRMASLGEIARGMAHEINNPLTIIQLLTNHTIKKVDTASANKEYLDGNLQKISDNTQRIAHIVSSLMAFSGRRKIEGTGPASVKNAIERALNLCREKFKNRKIDLSYDANQPEIFFHGDLLELSQVIYNLLTNSCDAVEHLNEKWVRIETSVVNNFAEIRVIDSGTGIKRENREKIFNPFFTTKEIGQGSGLGLSQSLGMMKQKGGNLYLDSHSSNTCFVIHIPELSVANNPL